MNNKMKLKPLVLTIPIVLLVLCVFATLAAGDSFAEGVTNLNNLVLQNFGWAFDMGVFVITISLFIAYFSPLGKVKIGGRKAVPLINKRTYFAVALCTMIATGMPIWGAAEIMAHYTNPPVSEGIAACSIESAKFGLRTVVLNYTFAPLSVYVMPSILIAFAFYNMKTSFSLSAMLAPLFGKKVEGKVGQIVDAICIFTLVCGLITSIGNGSESVLYGLSQLTGGNITKNTVTMSVLIAVIAVTFILSSATGLQKGIKFLSNMNIYFFIVVMAFVFVVGPTALIMNLGTETIGNFLSHFVGDMLNTRTLTGDSWAYYWTIFYFAVYLAWALISAAFLARVSYGYTVRHMITWIFILPSLFSGVWMLIFSITSLNMEMNGLGMAKAYAENYGSVVIRLFQNLPLSKLFIAVFIFMLFLSFVTAADSCTNAIAGLCTFGLSQEDAEPPMKLKAFWGILMGVASLFACQLLDINGLKAMCNVGSVPALIIEIIGIFALYRIMLKPGKYDVFKEDYDEYGNPLPQEEDKLN